VKVNVPPSSMGDIGQLLKPIAIDPQGQMIPAAQM